MKRSKHSLSNYKLLTCDMGKLIPVGAVPVIPGDTFQHRTSALIRVSPLLAPVMHPVVVRIHHWYVPYRILWDGFEDFITGGPDGLNAESPPTVTTLSIKGSVDDYCGIPPVAGLNVNAFYRRAYNKIYNENYRDQDLVTEIDEDQNFIQNISWEKDYYTASRPFTQKGDMVTLPVGGFAPVELTGSQVPAKFVQPNGQPHTAAQDIYSQANTGNIIDNNDVLEFKVDPNGTLQANLGSADQISVNDFRMGFALQRYKEARARYGSRFTEYLRYLGVRSSDARLQRPEYLGGGKQTISFSEVLQTMDDDVGADRGPLGKMGGHGIAALRSNRYRRFFEEHGVVMTMMSVRPKTMYMDGIHRELLKTTKEDFYQKELEHVGQQEIMNNEVYADAANGSDTFSYGDRYAEYRHHPSYVAGDFRDTLNHWHMGRSFGSPPVMNRDFTDCDATKRIHADQTGDVLWCMVNHSIQARRLVKKPMQHRVV